MNYAVAGLRVLSSRFLSARLDVTYCRMVAARAVTGGDGVLFLSRRAKLLPVQIFEKLGCLVELGSALVP